MGDNVGISLRGKAARGETSSTALPVPGCLDEAEFVAAAVQGDHAAFAALYDRHLDRVYRHCYYLTGNRADAEDLAQQTFLQAWRAIGRYRIGSTPFIAWLLTISHNLSVSQRRKQREVVGEDWLSRCVCADSDPEGTVLRDVTRDAAWNAISQLKPERQQVIILRFIEGFSVADVAAAIGKSQNNVNVIQHRALNDLRRILGVPDNDVHHSPRRGGRVLDTLASIRNVLDS